jgi:hypothetical protein
VGWNWLWVSWYCGHYWPIVPAPDNRWWWLWRNWWNEEWQGKSKYSEKICPSATLSTTNATWLDPGSNPDRCGRKPATNRLSYGAAFMKVTSLFCATVHKDGGTTRQNQAARFYAIPLSLLFILLQLIGSSLNMLCNNLNANVLRIIMDRSQWTLSLRHEMSSPAPTVGSSVRIPLGSWMSVCVCVCVVPCKYQPFYRLIPRPRCPTDSLWDS